MKKRKTKTAAKRKSGGKAPRQKGDRFERECVNFLLEHGVMAERVPLSGSAGGSFSADINVSLTTQGDDLLKTYAKHKFECKMRQRAWSELYKWLKDNFGLFIRCNNQEALVVLRLQDFVKLHGTQW